jgi:hypothetical protein
VESGDKDESGERLEYVEQGKGKAGEGYSRLMASTMAFMVEPVVTISSSTR